MGAPMAHRLHQAGYRLAVTDADAFALRAFTAEHDCPGPLLPAEIGSTCTVVITMLPDGKVVR